MFKEIRLMLILAMIYKNRNKFILLTINISILLLSQYIYDDIIEYLKLSNKTEFISYVLPIKWIIILLFISMSVNIIISLFKNSDKEDAILKKDEENIIVLKRKQEKLVEQLNEIENSIKNRAL